MSRNRDFVIVTDYPRQEIVRPNKLTTALAIFVVALSMIVLTSLPLALCLWTGALLMVINGVLTIDEAYRSVGWQTVFLLGGLIPLAIAMQSSGAAAWLSQQILSGLGDVPIWVLQTVLAIVTTVVTLADLECVGQCRAHSHCSQFGGACRRRSGGVCANRSVGHF